MNGAGYVKKLDNGDIRLQPGELVNKNAPSGNKLSFIILSRLGCTFKWFTDYLDGTNTEEDEYSTDGKTYKILKGSDIVYIREIRGYISSTVGYTLAEIPNVLKALRTVIADGI
jgi:hypothetical protein